MAVDEAKALQDLVTRGIKIPPQPRVLVELQEALMGDDYDTRSLARIITQDPGITAMLFKAARSPVFARGKKTDTLEQVLMVIGAKQTFNLVQAVALSTALSSAEKKAFEVFWQRSQDIAQLAALIAAERVTVCNVFPDQAYMAGIFHECGVAVLMQRFPEYCARVNLATLCCWPDLATEDKQIEIDHSSVGYLVARHWKLPDFVCAAIGYHYELPSAEVGTVRTLVAILQLATHYYLLLNRLQDRLWAKIAEAVLAELGLAPDDEKDFYDLVADKFVGA